MGAINESFNPINIEVQNLRKEVEELKKLLNVELEDQEHSEELTYEELQNEGKLTIKQIALLFYFKGYIDKSKSDTSELARLFAPVLGVNFKNLYDAFREVGPTENIKLQDLQAVYKYAKDNKIKSLLKTIEVELE